GYTAERTGRDVALLRRRPGFADLPCSRAGRIHVLDGVTLFSRPGPGLVDSLEALAAILGPVAD
ncbi:MAG: cobalamin-binding protein, partial [Gemmatimonadales bacterium]|nr:cobalamin-binding protein [Gemmatimonadales bacterium]